MECSGEGMMRRIAVDARPERVRDAILGDLMTTIGYQDLQQL